MSTRVLGIVRRMVAPVKYTLTLDGPDFRNIPSDSFRVEGTEWADYSDDPTDGVDPADLVMIGNDGSWQPGASCGDTECRLMNVPDGQVQAGSLRGQRMFSRLLPQGAYLGRRPGDGSPERNDARIVRGQSEDG